MVVLHYAGIGKNNASGVSVIVPRIVDSNAKFAQVGLFNYTGECFDTAEGVVRISDIVESDDYHNFPAPFNKPDVVLIHSPFGIPKVVQITKELKKDGIPYVIVPHGCFASHAMKKKRLKKTVARVLLFDKMVKDAAKIQYLSVGEQKSSIYKKKDSFIVPNGIDMKEFVKGDSDEDVLELSFIGRKDMYHKGLDLLIEACGKAKESIKNKVRLRIYGPADAMQNEALERAILEHGVQDFVFNEPAVFGEEKKNVYLNTDVFVLTSRFEGQPVAILEAWSYGVPTLVTPGTNVWEECDKQKCGWSVAQDAHAIAQTIIMLANDKECVDRCAKNAYDYVCDEYNWEKISDRYYKEFTSLFK